MPISSLLIINDFCATRGGADEVAIVEAASVAARGIPVHFAHMDAGIGDRCDPRLKQANITLHDYSSIGGIHRGRKFLFDGICNKAAIGELCKLSEKLGADCAVHVHGWTKGFSAAVFSLGTRLQRKVVYTLHDFVAACPNGAFYDFPSNTICTRKPLGLACTLCNCDRENRTKKIWRLVRQRSVRRNLHRGRQYQFRLTVSHFARRIFEKNSLTIDEVLPNPIDIEHIDFKDSSANQTFYFIGRLVPEKGADILAAAARAAKVTCCFVGAGPMEEALKREYPEHRFLGWQNKSAISGHLAQARAVVFSSRWYETQGLAPLEAAAHGVPTLCAETCAATENAIDGETGISFPQVTLPALTSALLRAQDDALISRLSHNVYKRFWAGSHGRESHADRLLALYNNINRM